jgi:YD repeat-containing protein
MKTLTALTLVLIVALTALPAAAQQGGVTRYVYDQNGRLHAVIAPNGEAAVYEYDPAGNFTAIRRLAADALEVLDFVPRQGAVGAQVTLYGVGFGAGVSKVEFNGTAATIIRPGDYSILVEVPPGATTGPIKVTTARASFTTRSPFTVKGVGIIPGFAVLLPGRSYQFQAVISGTTESGLKWSVNDIEGGNSSVGTITPSGLYTAPETLRGVNQFFVQAVSAADPTIAGEARVTITDVGVEAASAAVSVKIQMPPPPIDAKPFSAAVSVRVSQPEPPVPANPFSSAVSVRIGTPVEPLHTESFMSLRDALKR